MFRLQKPSSRFKVEFSNVWDDPARGGFKTRKVNPQHERGRREIPREIALAHAAGWCRRGWHSSPLTQKQFCARNHFMAVLFNGHVQSAAVQVDLFRWRTFVLQMDNVATGQLCGCSFRNGNLAQASPSEQSLYSSQDFAGADESEFEGPNPTVGLSRLGAGLRRGAASRESCNVVSPF